VPLIHAQYLYWYWYFKVMYWYWYWYLKVRYWYLYWYLNHWYWYWYWYLFIEYLIPDCGLGLVVLGFRFRERVSDGVRNTVGVRVRVGGQVSHRRRHHFLWGALLDSEVVSRHSQYTR